VDDLKKLDQAAMQQDAMFQAIRHQYPVRTYGRATAAAARPAAIATVAQWRPGIRRDLSAYEWLPCVRRLGLARLAGILTPKGNFCEPCIYHATAAEASETATRASLAPRNRNLRPSRIRNEFQGCINSCHEIHQEGSPQKLRTRRSAKLHFTIQQAERDVCVGHSHCFDSHVGAICDRAVGAGQH